MSEQMSTKLAEAARVYREAPENLKATILEAAEGGMRPAAITRAIEHAYTADYVAQERGAEGRLTRSLLLPPLHWADPCGRPFVVFSWSGL